MPRAQRGAIGRRSDHGLRRARVEVFQGLVFTTWNSGGPSLEDNLGDFGWYLRVLFGRARLRLGRPQGNRCAGSPARTGRSRTNPSRPGVIAPSREITPGQRRQVIGEKPEVRAGTAQSRPPPRALGLRHWFIPNDPSASPPRQPPPQRRYELATLSLRRERRHPQREGQLQNHHLKNSLKGSARFPDSPSTHRF